MLDAAPAHPAPTLNPDPAEAPVTPLGHCAGVYYVLTGSGELRACPGNRLERGDGVWDLFVGGQHNGFPVERWLHEFFPPLRKRKSDEAAGRLVFSKQCVGQWLMTACAQVGFYDPETPTRGLGVWRDEATGAAVAHCGTWLQAADGGRTPAGRVVAGAIYPAQPSPMVDRGNVVRLHDHDATAGDVIDFVELFSAQWGWSRPYDADAVIGWLGAALLGAHPAWRPHLLVNGKAGAGKSTLVKTLHTLLGPLSGGVFENYTEAGVRQSQSGKARPFLFDEAEGVAEDGRVDRVIEMLRATSGGGSTTVRGGADHKGASFALNGAGLLASIMPARLGPADHTRFVKIALNPLPNLEGAAYQSLVASAQRLGRTLWRRALARSPDWDALVEIYKTVVAGLGGDARQCATIGAVLAGYDLLTGDGLPDEDRLATARAIAEPLLDDARDAAEAGEGEQCLDRLYQSIVDLGRGDRRPLGELVAKARRGDDQPENALIQRFGLRLLHGKAGEPVRLAVVSGAHAQLNRIFAGTRWNDGRHRNALCMLDGVGPERSGPTSYRNTRIGGRKSRYIAIPERLLPREIDDAVVKGD